MLQTIWECQVKSRLPKLTHLHIRAFPGRRTKVHQAPVHWRGWSRARDRKGRFPPSHRGRAGRRTAARPSVRNQRGGYPLSRVKRLYPGDVRKFDYSEIKGEVDLLAGGPPCQPFSIGGKHRGRLDKRDMFPQMARAVRELKPRAFMVEEC